MSQTVTTIQLSATASGKPTKNSHLDQSEPPQTGRGSPHWNNSHVLEVNGTNIDLELAAGKTRGSLPTKPALSSDSNKIAMTNKLDDHKVINETTKRGDNNSASFSLNELDHFLAQINPIDTLDWAQSSLHAKVMGVIRAPILLLTILTVPVVNNEKLNGNWCRLLNSIHCFTMPIGIVALTNLMGSLNSAPEGRWWFSSTGATHENQTMGAPLTDTLNLEEALAPYSKYFLLIPGLLLALYIFLTTSPSKPPRYHALFAYFGFLMSVLWIYKLANEIISLLKTIGIIFSMSDTAIGLGFLAWGNSLGDIVANLTLAQAGYARMALGASIGAPLLNLLLGFGLAFTISLKPGEALEIDYNDTMTLLAGSLALVLILLMASTVLAQNRSKKPFGYLLIACYGLYFILAVCLECDLI